MAATQQDLSSAPTPVVNGPVRHRALWPLEFYRSAVGKKWVMAVTGIIGIGFVLGHMVGNLKVYLGADDMNHYGEFLRELLYPLLPRTGSCGSCGSASSAPSSCTSTPPTR